MTTDDHVDAKLAASIRANFLSVSRSSLAFAHVAIAATCVVFWTHAPASRLLLWAALQSSVILAAAYAARRAAPERFRFTAIVGEAAGSASWATLALFAFPERPDWQTMQGLLLIGLMIASLGRATADPRLHIASTLPLTVVALTVFAFRGAGAAQWVPASFAVAFPFVISAGAVLRRVQYDLFASSIRNETLATTLRLEGERLKDVNNQLETANSHLDEQSRHDVLTKLYNRAGFLRLLEEAVAESPGQVVVCYLDLDGFKRLNDAFGHRFGDLILCAASRRISKVLHQNEVLARQGGDELTIFGYIDDMDGDVSLLGERILAVFADPFLIEARRVEVNVSVGLAWLPESTTADDLMRFADTALYKAKEVGGNQFEVFDDEMRIELDRRAKLQIDLGAAIQRAELMPHVQPIVEIGTGTIVAGEALARWIQTDGVRAATDFVDTARDLGVLDRINDIVVQQVSEYQRFSGASGERQVPITVNVSSIHLDAMLNRVLSNSATNTVIFELTEGGLFSNLDEVSSQLHRARAAGIKIFLDDFGLGFSSLAIATRLPVDGFKIDREFVASLASNPSAVAVVEAIVQLADRMNLVVIAEGVETHEQLALLRDLGVGFAQGYLFSPAVPMARFGEWVAEDFRFDVSGALAEAYQG